MNKKMIKVEDQKIFINQNLLRIRGVNLGNWLLLENFMMGLKGIDSYFQWQFQEMFGKDLKDKFFNKLRANMITEKDIAFIAKQGLNTLRLPINYRLFEDSRCAGQWVEASFKYLDELFAWAKKYGLYVLLDLHAAPGGQNNTPPADNGTGRAHLYLDDHYLQRSLWFWEGIVRRYQKEEALLGYDLINEPDPEDPAELMRVYAEMTKVIRKHDKEHLIVLEACFDEELPLLEESLFEDPLSVYSFHTYPYFWNTTYPTDTANKEAMKQQIKKHYDFGRRIKRPVLLGECGLNSIGDREESSTRIAADLFDINKEGGGHWCLWAYKDLKVMGLMHVDRESNWYQFVEDEHMQRRFDEGSDGRKKNFDDNYIARLKKNPANRKLYDLAFNREKQAMWLLQLRYQWETLRRRYSDEEILRLPEAFHFDKCRSCDWKWDFLNGC